MFLSIQKKFRKVKYLFSDRGEPGMVDLDDDYNMVVVLAIQYHEEELRVRHNIADQFRRDRSNLVGVGPVLGDIRLLHE